MTSTYGAEGRLLQRTGSTEVASYVYDAAYRVVQVRDAKGNATSFAYNLRGETSVSPMTLMVDERA